VSWFVAVLFAPIVGAAVLKPPEGGTKEAPPGITMRAYQSLLAMALRFRWITILGTIALFAIAIWALRFVPQQFFPASDRTEVLVDITLQQNASLRASEEVAKRLDKFLAKDADVERWSAYVGRGAIRFYLPLNVQLPNDFFAQHVIVAKDVAGRERLQVKLERLLAEEFPGVVARVYPLELGPPVGWPVQYRLVGPDIERLRDLASDLANVVAAHPNTRRVSFDWLEPARQLRILIDQDQVRRIGYSSEALAAVLNTAVSGTTITQLRDGIYLVDVVARTREDDRIALDTLRTLQVPLPNGRTVALSQFATFVAEQEQPIVWRRNRIPTLTVQADLVPGALAEGIVADLAPKIAELNARLPAGYRIELGGVAEESAESRASVLAVVPLMLFLMLTFLMLQLQSFQRLAIIVTVIPLGLIGVVAALLLAQKPLGFVAVLGVLALLGMIAKKCGDPLHRSRGRARPGCGGSRSRDKCRHIAIPPFNAHGTLHSARPRPHRADRILGTMAFAIMGGLLVATLLTLVFLPVLYVTWFTSQAHEGKLPAQLSLSQK
jgi:multidrug efflux pump subunit AcrB